MEESEADTRSEDSVKDEVRSFTGTSGNPADAETGAKVRAFMERLDEIYAESKGMEAKKRVSQVKIQNSILLYGLPQSISSKIESFITQSNGCAAGVSFACDKADKLYDYIMKWCDGAE